MKATIKLHICREEYGKIVRQTDRQTDRQRHRERGRTSNGVKETRPQAPVSPAQTPA